jgi:hypothetical protein
MQVKNDSLNLVAADEVLPSNFLFHKLFKDVILRLNNQQIEGGNCIYNQKAILETILNYNSDTKSTNLLSLGYSEDLDVRKKWLKESKSFIMCGSLQLDFFNQPKYLIPGVNVYLQFLKNSAKTCLQTVLAKPIIKILDAKLHVRRVKVDPSVLIGHQLGLNTQNARYQIRTTKLVSFGLSIGSLGFYKDQIFSDSRLPKFVLITFQSSRQYEGNKNVDTSLYQHLNVTNITLSRNNDYRETYSQDFENDKYMSSYVVSLIRNMGYLDKNLNCGITSVDFKNKYPFFTFVLAPDFDFNQIQLPRQGNLRLDVKFGKALVEASNIIIYGIFDNEIQIRKDKTVLI